MQVLNKTINKTNKILHGEVAWQKLFGVQHVWVLIRIVWFIPPPPHSGVGGTACVFPKVPVKGYFSRDKVRSENCKQGGVFDFSPEDFF